MEKPSKYITRREMLTRSGAAVGAGLLLPNGLAGCSTESDRANESKPMSGAPIVFAHTTVVTGDANRAALKDVALAVKGNTIAAIGLTDDVIKQFPDAEVIDGRNKALFPGLINCHAHLSAAVARGFNEDFGFP
ncbi:MAG: hypothetical protein RIF39_15770, partial [Cyclobacteriaceae bacterium]